MKLLQRVYTAVHREQRILNGDSLWFPYGYGMSLNMALGETITSSLGRGSAAAASEPDARTPAKSNGDRWFGSVSGDCDGAKDAV